MSAESDYKELSRLTGQLFNEGWGGQLIDHGPNAKYTAYSAKPGQSFSKGNVPTTAPGGGSSRYESGVSGNYQIPTVTIVSDEEVVEERDISNVSVLKKINELMVEAESYAQEDCLIALGSLRDYVNTL